MNNGKGKNIEPKMDATPKKYTIYEKPSLPKETSMGTLIIWNVSKAIEINPTLQLHGALRDTQQHLEHEADVARIMSQKPVERHLSCALLAWQQLGHQHADSLCSFVKERMEAERVARENAQRNMTPPSSLSFSKGSFITYEESYSSRNNPSYCTSPLMGPVLKLPNDNKIVMQMQSHMRCQKMQCAGKDLRQKIEEACCLEKGCVEKLALLGKQSKELEARLAKLTKRENERVQLLERAEAAWRDLEMGYLRRHRAAIEKEEDLTRQGNKVLDERNNYKEVCIKLVELLKPRAEAADKFREQLKDLETQVCEAAVERLKLVDQVACQDAILSGIHCKMTQQDRDLQFKEDQARRKLQAKESELESTSALMYDAERTMRSELNGMRQQIKNVSKELYDEDKTISKIKKEIEELQQEKAEITEDLEGCQQSCDKDMQGTVDKIKNRRAVLEGLKLKVIACKCKLPQDVAVEVKRTPSLAALCQCSPEDRALVSCSCTSFRSRLLSDLLKDLFGGLQSELGPTSIKMPCQLLKCLEDGHSWDRASVVKSNLRNFFAKLLVGELEIAIANSIEKYHARWVGGTCADIARTIPNEDEFESSGWEDRAIALKAQRLANQLAEKIYEEKANEVISRAKEIIRMGPPPCDCKPPKDEACYRCTVQSQFKTSSPVRSPSNKLQTRTTYAYWQRTHNDVTQLRAQIAELKKETIKKGDLKSMEQNISRIVQRASMAIKEASSNNHLALNEGISSPRKKHLLLNIDSVPEKDTSAKNNLLQSSGLSPSKIIYIERSGMDIDNYQQNKVVSKKVTNPSKKTPSFEKSYRRQYAVNVCFCGSHKRNPKNNKLSPNPTKGKLSDNKVKESLPPKQKFLKSVAPDAVIKSSKPIKELTYPNEEKPTENRAPEKPTCGSNCACFNTVPSCTSINELLSTLNKWKTDLNAHPFNLNKEYNSRRQRQFENILSKNDVESENDVNNTVIKTISQLKSSEINDEGRYPDFCNSSMYKDSNKNNIVVSVNQSKTAFQARLSPTLMTNAQSEYMGAVNLDRSNENFCKCVIDGEMIYTSSNQVFQNSTIRCTSPCKQKKTRNSPNLQKVHSKNDRKDIKRVSNDSSSNKSPPDFKTLPKNHSSKKKIEKSTINSPSSGNNRKQMISENIENSDDIEQLDGVDKTSRLSMCDCGYQINFLGVTLNNVNSNQKIVINSKESDNTAHLSKSNKPIKYAVSCFPPISTETSDLLNPRKPNDTNLYPDLKCQCNVKMDELKAYFQTALNKDIKDSGQDKALDTKSFIFNMLEKEETCICCDKEVVEESSDLEVNTFYLLERHLKKKFEEFKDNCQSVCIQPLEEDKLFTTILRKIKQVISESAEKVVCKCSGESKREGSWQRAHDLLQEYLKTKIKRVQCSCSSPNQSKDNILPDLTERVCLLIENDFQRLKDLCQCKNEEDVENTQKNTHKIIEIPERDTNSEISAESAKNHVENFKGNFLTTGLKHPVILTQHTSAQILPDQVAKSCEALEKGDFMKMITVETQKSDTKVLNAEKYYVNEIKPSLSHSNLVDIVYDTLLRQTFEIIENSEKQDLKTSVTDVENAFNKNSLEGHNSYKNLTFPFMGYTVDCSCNNNLGRCVCSKSLIQEKNSEIDKLWKTYGSNITGNKDISYIMKSNPIKTDDVSNVKIADHLFVDNMPKPKPKTISKLSETNDYRGWNITLKDSWEHVSKESRHNFTSTAEEDGSGTSIVEPLDDPLNQYNSASQTEHNIARIKSVHFPKHKPTYQTNNDCIAKDALMVPELLFEGCECSMVPICHVKMLVENIENKLAHSECTCDSLSSQVCPVHSQRNLS